MLLASLCPRAYLKCRPCSTRWLSQQLLRLLQQEGTASHFKPRHRYPRRDINPRAQFLQVWLALTPERRFAILEQLIIAIEPSRERDRLLRSLAQALAQVEV